MPDREHALSSRLRWWWQRVRKARTRPVYANGEQARPLCNHRWRTECRWPRGRSWRKSDWPTRLWYVCMICVHCRAIRCGDRANPKPCILHRHHEGAHRYD